MTNLFDTHAHYDDERFDGVREGLLSSLPKQGIALVVNVGSSLETSERSAALADRYPFIYFSAGIHPDSAARTLNIPDRKERLSSLLTHRKCVAIGEIGLDYYYGKDDREAQLKMFREQLGLAAERKKPVIVHDRDAHGDCLEMIKEFPTVKGVFHCFSGSIEMARELFSLGWYISIGGVVTFKNARKLVEVAEALPSLHPEAMKRLLLETDCPYLAPVPHRGETNHSGFMKYTVERLSELLCIDCDTLCKLTCENGKRFYGITDGIDNCASKE